MSKPTAAAEILFLQVKSYQGGELHLQWSGQPRALTLLPSSLLSGQHCEKLHPFKERRLFFVLLLHVLIFFQPVNSRVVFQSLALGRVLRLLGPAWGNTFQRLLKHQGIRLLLV